MLMQVWNSKIAYVGLGGWSVWEAESVSRGVRVCVRVYVHFRDRDHVCVREHGTRGENLKMEKATSRFHSPPTGVAHGRVRADVAVGVGASVAAAGVVVDADVHTSAGGNGTVCADDVRRGIHDVGVPSPSPSPSPCHPSPSPALAQIPTYSGSRYIPQVAALAPNEEAKRTVEVQKQLAQKMTPHPKDYAHQLPPQMAFSLSASTS
jgi:hypothetical protein